MRYRRLKPNEIVRKTDESFYVLNGKRKWAKVGGYGFKAKDSMLGNVYRRKVSR